MSYRASAKKVFDYVFNTKTALNINALFSDGTEYYRTPAEPELGQSVTLRFRTKLGNVDTVYIVYNGERREMKIGRKDSLFDYFEHTIAEVNDDIEYYFEIHAGSVICLYNKLGAQKVLNPEYNFRIVPGYKVPEWAKGAIFYQIFVDRFCNGDESNDVLDNEYCYIGEGTKRVTDWFKNPDLVTYDGLAGVRILGVMKADAGGIIERVGIDTARLPLARYGERGPAEFFYLLIVRQCVGRSEGCVSEVVVIIFIQA